MAVCLVVMRWTSILVNFAIFAMVFIHVYMVSMHVGEFGILGEIV